MGNKLIGTTSVKLGIYEQSNDSQLEGMLGDKKEFEDGRVFVLCKAGEGLDAGYLVQAVANLAASDSLAVADDAAAGSKEIVVDAVTDAEYAVHALRDGYLVGAAVAGDIGQFYKIKDNTAMANGSEATITLYDGITNAFAGDSTQVSICANPYIDVVIDANTAPLIGVPLRAVSSGYYFWALCEGIGPAVATAAGITAGDYVMHDAGSVVKSASTACDTEKRIGVAYTAFAASEGGIVKYFPLA